jgi:hypothetical protein
MSPDWSAKVVPVPYSNLGDPQTLNLYAYVKNNPVLNIDLNGHAACDGNFICIQNQQFDQLHGTQWELHAAFDEAAQAYDKSKTGPEDPTQSGQPLFKNSTFQGLVNKAWEATGNGHNGNGLAEASLNVEFDWAHPENGISFSNFQVSDHADGKQNKMSMTPDKHTLAFLHTHGVGNDSVSIVQHPSWGDRDSRRNAIFPNFVKSSMALYVTLPHTEDKAGYNSYIQLTP